MLNLTRLTASDIVTQWAAIRHAVQGALPPTFAGDPDAAMSHIMEAMKAGIYQVWVMDEDGIPIHITVTEIWVDQHTKATSLFVFAWYAVREVSREAFEYSIEKLKQFADVNRCEKICFYTDLDSLAKMFVDRYGATMRQFVTLEVNHDK